MTDESDPRFVRPSGKRHDPTSRDRRAEFARDLDRFLYDPYWQRLAETTQVYAVAGIGQSPMESRLTHTRMTHTQKVAQVGRRLAEHLQQHAAYSGGVHSAGGLDPDVVEAACLAHDFGHPPFGHRGEEELDRLALEHGLTDGFEGNAQTFRIITLLSQHDPVAGPTHGMDLTRATVAASVKYPWARARGNDPSIPSLRRKKFGYYDADAPAFERQVEPLLRQRNGGTLEARVMDWADDISYAVHDVEDFYRLGLIPLDRLRHVDDSTTNLPLYELASRDNRPLFNTFMDAVYEALEGQDFIESTLREYFQEYSLDFPMTPYEGLQTQDAMLRAFASRVISDCTAATWINNDGVLAISRKMRLVVEALKTLTWHFVIDRPHLAGQQSGQVQMLERVFSHLLARVEATMRRQEPDSTGGHLREVSDRQRALRRRGLPTRLQEFLALGIEQQLQSMPMHSVSHEEDELDEETLTRLAIRAVLDYVSSLTERDIRTYAQMLGPRI